MRFLEDVAVRDDRASLITCYRLWHRDEDSLEILGLCYVLFCHHINQRSHREVSTTESYLYGTIEPNRQRNLRGLPLQLVEGALSEIIVVEPALHNVIYRSHLLQEM